MKTSYILFIGILIALGIMLFSCKQKKSLPDQKTIDAHAAQTR